MKTIRILNVLFLAIFLFVVHQMYQDYHERNEKIEKENQLAKLKIASSFPVREADFYLTRKDAPVQKKVEVQAPKEEDAILPSTEDLLEKTREATSSLETNSPELPKEKQTPIKSELKEVKKVAKIERTEKKMEISKAIVIEKKENPVKKPVEQPKKSAPVVTEIKEVKLPKVAPGEIQEIEGTFDPN